MKQKRILSLVIVFAMMLGLMATMPTTAYADGYKLWVGGVQVTNDNKDHVLGPGNESVKFNPTTNTLTLNNATIEGNVPDKYNNMFGIESDIPLTIKLIGKNTITSADSKNHSHAIFARDLTIEGPGELIANYGTSENGSSSITFADELIIKGATVIAKGSSSSIEKSIGISSETGILKIEDGSRVCIQGNLFALEPSLDLSNYSNPIVEVDTEYDGLNKKEIDAPYPDFANSGYKYVCIRPEGTTPTPSGTYLPTGNMNWNLFGPPVVSEPAQDIIIKENVISFTVGESEYVLNRTKIAMDGTPYIKSDRIMLPVRYVAEAMDMKVEYDNDTRVATFKDDKRTITINIDTGIMTLDGKEYPLEVKPEITNDRIYLPLGLIADALGMTRDNPQSGYDISWYPNTKTATITIRR